MKRKPASDLDSVLTIREAATLMGLSERRVLVLCVQGRIEARQGGGAWLISRASAMAYRPGPAGRPRKVPGAP